MDNQLATQGVGKRLSGNYVLTNVSIELPKGKITGLLGPNGSGKTTLLCVLAGLMQPSVGQVLLEGKHSGDVRVRKAQVALMPDVLSFPSWMKGKDAFAYYQDNYRDFDPQRKVEMVKLLDIPEEMPIRHMSKGMKERLTLGLTLSRRAKAYLLDEPLGGIDPIGKEIILNTLLSTEFEDAALLVSTHLLRDIERIFDSVYMIGGGNILYHAPDCEKMREESGQSVEDMYRRVFGHD